MTSFDDGVIVGTGSGATVTNASFLTDFAELFVYEEELIIAQLLTQTVGEDPTAANFLSGTDAANRLQSMMNWGADQIRNILRNIYPVDVWTYTDAPSTVKGWNARYVIARLEERRFVRSESPREVTTALNLEIEEYAKPGARKILEGGRTEMSSFESGALQDGVFKVDDVAQFGNLENPQRALW